MRSKPERRPPGPCSAGGKNLHLAYPAQTINKLPVDPSRHPTPGQELSQVRVPRQLKGNAGSLGDFRMVRRMRQQNARAVTI